MLKHWFPTWTPYALSAGFILIFVGLINLVNLFKKYKYFFFSMPAENQPAYVGPKNPLNPGEIRGNELFTTKQRTASANSSNSQNLDELKRHLQFSIQALSLTLLANFVKGIADLEIKQTQLINLLEEYLTTHHQLNNANIEYGWNAFFLEKNLVGKIVDMTLELKSALSKSWSDTLRPDVHRMGNASVAYLNVRHTLLDSYSSE